MRTRLLTVVLLAVLACMAGVRDAAACSCMRGTPCQYWGWATTVFVGDVVDVQRQGYAATVRLRVVRAYKGAVTTGAIVTMVNEGSSCDLTWGVGERWVVYAHGDSPTLQASLCSGSRRLTVDAPLPELKPEPGVVDGWLVRPHAAKGELPWIDGARVWIDAPAGRIEARTGERGRFRLAGIPPGTWPVQFAIAGGDTASAEADLTSADRCATVRVPSQPAPR